MGKYLDIAKQFEWRGMTTPERAVEIPAATQAPDPDTWLCPHCDRDAVIDDVFPSQDGERILTMWRCESCQVVAVTPDAIRQPPPGWRKRTQ